MSRSTRSGIGSSVYLRIALVEISPSISETPAGCSGTSCRDLVPEPAGVSRVTDRR
jgi:hypothetical protein